MGLFDRIGTVIKSNLNSLVSGAEDPEKMLEQSVEDMQEDLVSLRQAVAQAIAGEKRVEQQLAQNRAQADQWQQRAALALSKNEEDLAREALTRKKGYAEAVVGLETQMATQREQVQKLRQNLTALEGKLSEAKAKKDLLVARARSAKASEQINEVLGRVSTSSAYGTFERMEQKVSDLEARSAAVGELATDNLEDKFKSLQAGGVEDDLAALKASMGMLPANETPKSLPEAPKDPA